MICLRLAAIASGKPINLRISGRIMTNRAPAIEPFVFPIPPINKAHMINRLSFKVKLVGSMKRIYEAYSTPAIPEKAAEMKNALVLAAEVFLPNALTAVSSERIALRSLPYGDFINKVNRG